MGSGSQELVPLCYACIYLATIWLLLQAERLLEQSHRKDKLHADTEHEDAKQRPPTIKFSRTCDREWVWNDEQVFPIDPSLKWTHFSSPVLNLLHEASEAFKTGVCTPLLYLTFFARLFKAVIHL